MWLPETPGHIDKMALKQKTVTKEFPGASSAISIAWKYAHNSEYNPSHISNTVTYNSTLPHFKGRVKSQGIYLRMCGILCSLKRSLFAK